jgi:hypothetical protein
LSFRESTANVLRVEAKKLADIVKGEYPLIILLHEPFLHFTKSSFAIRIVCPTVFSISFEDFDRILKNATETSPVSSLLKDSIKIATETFVIPCDVSEAEMLRDVAQHFSPETVSKINAAIRASKMC